MEGNRGWSSSNIERLIHVKILNNAIICFVVLIIISHIIILIFEF